jgi:hypothetical protein
MGIIVLSLDIVRRILQKAGPYLLVVLLPGGSVLALLLFLYRRRPRQSTWLDGLPSAITLGRCRSLRAESHQRLRIRRCRRLVHEVNVDVAP